jgi:hypothetical protein
MMPQSQHMGNKFVWSYLGHHGGHNWRTDARNSADSLIRMPLISWLPVLPLFFVSIDSNQG